MVLEEEVVVGVEAGAEVFALAEVAVVLDLEVHQLTASVLIAV